MTYIPVNKLKEKVIIDFYWVCLKVSLGGYISVIKLLKFKSYKMIIDTIKSIIFNFK